MIGQPLPVDVQICFWTQTTATDLTLVCNQTSGDPYRYIRTGNYAKILANEEAESGKLAKPVWWKEEAAAAAKRSAAKGDNARGYKGKPMIYW